MARNQRPPPSKGHILADLAFPRGKKNINLKSPCIAAIMMHELRDFQILQDPWKSPEITNGIVVAKAELTKMVDFFSKCENFEEKSFESMKTQGYYRFYFFLFFVY